MKTLTWKEEDDNVGPARLYDNYEAETMVKTETGRMPFGVPYGTPLPGTDLGWQTRAAARRLAKQHGAEFLEV